MVDQPNRCQTWLPTLLKIENFTTNHHVKIVNVYKKWFSSETTVLTRSIKMRQWWYSCLFDVYMDCCWLSVTGPQTSISQAILIKRYSKHYRHNVKSPYECFIDQNGVHGYTGTTKYSIAIGRRPRILKHLSILSTSGKYILFR
jgi:hypothetical protein